MKHIISFLLPIGCLLATGCSNEIIEIATEPTTEHVGFKSVGNTVEVNLNLNSMPFTEEVSTRAEHPVEYAPQNDKEREAIEIENVMRTFWIFEFDQETHELIHEPYYDVRGSDSGSETFYHSCALSDDYGKPVILYAVVNADDKNDVANWCKLNEATGEYDGFMTMEELEAQILPTTYAYAVQRENDNDQWPPYYYRDTGNLWASGIPKSGKIENVIVTEEEDLTIPVTNMYGKVLIYSRDNKFTIGQYLFNILVENIPCYCRVGALASDTTTIAFEYPDTTHWTYFYLANLPSGYASVPTQSEYEGKGAGEGTNGEDDIFPPLLIIYVPENIQGENEVSYERDENVPSSNYTEKIYDDPTGGKLTSVAGETDALAVHFYSNARSNWYGPIYPGGNNTTNFNVRRNCSYRVIFDFLGDEEEE